MWSLRSSERGLKYGNIGVTTATAMVAPFVGAWIEIIIAIKATCAILVAPFVGAWIEMYASSTFSTT